MSGAAPKPTLNNPKVAVDDDLDDLDDVLDEFNPKSPIISPPVPPNTSTTASFTTTTTRPRTNTRVDAPPKSIPGAASSTLDPTLEDDEDALSAEFAKELAKGMESLMRDITSGDSTEKGDTSKDNDEEERAKVFKAAWEAMLVEGIDGQGAGALAGLGELLGEEGLKGKAEGNEKKTPAPAGDFQSRLKQAMDKVKESESNLKSDAGSGVPNPESLETLLSSLKDLGLGDETNGEPDDNELAGFLENMMGQLMSKEVLYEPLKELADSFPGYLASPPAPLSAEDKTRFENQLACVRRIIAVFDSPGYSDTDEKSNKQIVDLMSEMQSHGSPPPELMGPLPPGFESMANLGGDGDCVIA